MCKAACNEYGISTPCDKCIIKLQKENYPIWEVFYRSVNQDIFKTMEMVGIHKNDQLFCFDLISVAKVAILKKQQKGKNEPRWNLRNS